MTHNFDVLFLLPLALEKHSLKARAQHFDVVIDLHALERAS